MKLTGINNKKRGSRRFFLPAEQWQGNAAAFAFAASLVFHQFSLPWRCVRVWSWNNNNNHYRGWRDGMKNKFAEENSIRTREIHSNSLLQSIMLCKRHFSSSQIHQPHRRRKESSRVYFTRLSKSRSTWIRRSGMCKCVAKVHLKGVILLKNRFFSCKNVHF